MDTPNRAVVLEYDLITIDTHKQAPSIQAAFGGSGVTVYMIVTRYDGYMTNYLDSNGKQSLDERAGGLTIIPYAKNSPGRSREASCLLMHSWLAVIVNCLA